MANLNWGSTEIDDGISSWPLVVVVSAPSLVAGCHSLSGCDAISMCADTSSTTGGLVSSTHLAHRLQTYTLLNHPDLQLPLAMSLFSLVHEAGVAPSDRPALAAVAVQHGVFPSQEEALRFLDSDQCDAEVKRAYTMARRVGVTGVPFFVFQDRYAASGALGVDVFVKVSRRGRGRGLGMKSEWGAGCESCRADSYSCSRRSSVAPKHCRRPLPQTAPFRKTPYPRPAQPVHRTRPHRRVLRQRVYVRSRLARFGIMV
jgi:hypothetical protein